jgi:hypothetical protein
MRALLTFTEQFNYADDPAGILLPVTLSYGGKTLSTNAKVDPGAAVCLFSLEIGLQLGVPVESDIPIVLTSFLGGALDAFGHEVILETGNLTFQTTVYFAKYPGLPRNFLGRQGWLRKLKLGLIDYDNLLYLNAYD